MIVNTQYTQAKAKTFVSIMKSLIILLMLNYTFSASGNVWEKPGFFKLGTFSKISSLISELCKQ